jgi:hypothetical protein
MMNFFMSSRSFIGRKHNSFLPRGRDLASAKRSIFRQVGFGIGPSTRSFTLAEKMFEVVSDPRIKAAALCVHRDDTFSPK